MVITGVYTVPNLEGDLKYSKRGPKGDPILSKKRTLRGPKGDSKLELFKIIEKSLDVETTLSNECQFNLTSIRTECRIPDLSCSTDHVTELEAYCCPLPAHDYT